MIRHGKWFFVGLMISLLLLAGCKTLTELERYVGPDSFTYGGASWNVPAPVDNLGAGTDAVYGMIDRCPPEKDLKAGGECSVVWSGMASSETLFESLAQAALLGSLIGPLGLAKSGTDVTQNVSGVSKAQGGNAVSSAKALADADAKAIIKFNRHVHYGGRY